MLKKLFGNVWFVWFVLSIPFLWLAYDHFVNHAKGGKLFYWSGVFGIWFLLACLAVTPLMRMFRGAPWTRWLLKNRRYMGVAAFGYSALHVVYWMQRAKPIDWLKSFLELLVLLGWIAFFIFIAMALTSNDWSVRRLGPNWKRLQRWIYLAVPLALVHWFMAEKFNSETVTIYGGIFAVIILLRVALKRTTSRAA